MRNWKGILPALLGANALLVILSGLVGSSAGPNWQTAPALSGSAASAPSRAVDVLRDASAALNRIATKATPAVVSISSIKVPESTRNPVDFSIDPSEQQVQQGIGSGVIIRPEGIILTNDHVIQNAQRVTVTLEEKNKMQAHVIGRDPKTDLAVIQLDHPPVKNLPTLSFGDSEQIEVGDWIIAVGSPFGLNRTVTSGIVSAKGRAQLGMLDTEDFIQTDAAINPGNSGGPLLNDRGEMVGVNTAIFSLSGGFSGIGFAIPSKIARQVFTEILEHGRVIRGWIGMTTQDIDEDLAEYFSVRPNHGALISDIQENGPASHASLRAGDVILSYDHIPIESARHLKTLVTKTHSPKQIVIGISRNGKQENRVTLIREQPIKQMAGQASSQDRADSSPNLGLVVQDIPPEFAQLFGVSIRSGAMVTEIKVGSPAFEAGISKGDIILSANKTEIHSAKELLELIRNRKKDFKVVVLYIQRGPGEKVFVPIRSARAIK